MLGIVAYIRDWKSSGTFGGALENALNNGRTEFIIYYTKCGQHFIDQDEEMLKDLICEQFRYYAGTRNRSGKVQFHPQYSTQCDKQVTEMINGNNEEWTNPNIDLNINVALIDGHPEYVSRIPYQNSTQIMFLCQGHMECDISRVFGNRVWGNPECMTMGSSRWILDVVKPHIGVFLTCYSVWDINDNRVKRWFLLVKERIRLAELPEYDEGIVALIESLKGKDVADAYFK